MAGDTSLVAGQPLAYWDQPFGRRSFWAWKRQGEGGFRRLDYRPADPQKPVRAGVGSEKTRSPRHGGSAATETRPCSRCGRPVPRPKRGPWGRYCSPACRGRAYRAQRAGIPGGIDVR